MMATGYLGLETSLEYRAEGEGKNEGGGNISIIEKGEKNSHKTNYIYKAFSCINRSHTVYGVFLT